MTDYQRWRGTRTGATLWRVSSPGSEHRIIPDGVLDLMWFQGRLTVAGADTRPVTVETAPGEVTWGLRFAPGVAKALLGVDAQELTNQRVDLSDLVRTHNARAARGSAEVPDLEEIAISLWAHADPDRATLRLAESMDRAARAGLSVGETAARHGMSERSLRRISNALFGYGPKMLMQIHRFQRALHLARSGTSLSYAAAAAGYVDQAHFARKSRQLAGRTPSELAAVA